MTTRPPAEIGMTLDEVDTPALIVDLDAFERNLRRLPERIAGTGVRVRPHAKTHKCPVIALKQVALGAVGVCVPEGQRGRGDGPGRRPGRARHQRDRRPAEIAAAGVARAYRPDRRLRRRSEPGPRARRGGGRGRDHPAGLCRGQHGRQPLRRRAGRAGARARRGRSRDAPHLTFGGLQAYHGSAQHLRGWEERRQAIAGAADKAGRTRDLLARHGIECPTITGAGTGTFEFEIGERRLHRIAMRLLHLHGRRLRPQSRPRRRPDQGLRAEPLRLGDGDEPPDRGPRDRRRRPEGARLRLGPAARLGRARRHLRARLRRARPPRHHRPPPTASSIGDKIRLVPGHCDPTVNLYDWYVGIRGDRVEQLWPITARGAVY